MVKKSFKDISLSRLGMGTMRLPMIPGGKDSDIDYEKGQPIIDYAMAHGINYYDSAYVYHGGQSEVFTGKALSKYPRDSYYITTKYNFGANPDYKQVFEQQLERFGVDRIDFYLIHCLTDGNFADYSTNGCIEYFEEMRRQGKITYLGFSSHSSPETLEKFADLHDWDFAQIQLNYYDWLYGRTQEEYKILADRNIPIMVMESIRGGRLASLTPEAEALLKAAQPDWSIASWGFRWLKKLEHVQVALSGMGTLEQIEDNVKTYEDDRALTDEEEQLLFKACDMFHSQVVVPCTACRYCTEGCPMQINIPEVLKLYNRFKLQGAWVLNELPNVDTKGQPTDCIGCGACTGHCPQNISIPDIMAEMTEALANK